MRGQDARRGRARRRDRHLRPLLRAARVGRDGDAPRRRPRPALRRPLLRRPAGRGRRRGARQDRRDQAQRRARDEHGHGAGEIAARGQGGQDLPRHHRRAGARAAQAARRAAAARAHELVRHARRHACARSSSTPELESDVPADFLQNKEPKITVEDRFPVEWPDDPQLEWCPPGHGDVYTALQTSGTLEALLDAGYEYAFLSNSDNLGAVLDPRVLDLVRGRGAPVRDGGVREDARRPQGRPPGGAQGDRPAGAARDRADARGGPREASATSTPGSTSTPTTCGSTCARWPRCSTRTTACSGCR